MKIKISKTKQDHLTPAIVEVRIPLMEDLLEANKFTNPTEISASLVSQICTFDGKSITMEDVMKLPISDFLELTTELSNIGYLGSPKVLSTLSEKVDSALPK